MLALGVVEVAEEDLLGQRERPAEPRADHLETAAAGFVDLLDELRSGFNGGHVNSLCGDRRRWVQHAPWQDPPTQAVF